MEWVGGDLTVAGATGSGGTRGIYMNQTRKLEVSGVE